MNLDKWADNAVTPVKKCAVHSHGSADYEQSPALHWVNQPLALDCEPD